MNRIRTILSALVVATFLAALIYVLFTVDIERQPVGKTLSPVKVYSLKVIILTGTSGPITLWTYNPFKPDTLYAFASRGKDGFYGEFIIYGEPAPTGEYRGEWRLELPPDGGPDIQITLVLGNNEETHTVCSLTLPKDTPGQNITLPMNLSPYMNPLRYDSFRVEIDDGSPLPANPRLSKKSDDE